MERWSWHEAFCQKCTWKTVNFKYNYGPLISLFTYCMFFPHYYVHLSVSCTEWNTIQHKSKVSWPRHQSTHGWYSVSWRKALELAAALGRKSVLRSRSLTTVSTQHSINATCHFHSARQLLTINDMSLMCVKNIHTMKTLWKETTYYPLKQQRIITDQRLVS